MLVFIEMTYLNPSSVKYVLLVCKGKSQRLNFVSLKAVFERASKNLYFFLWSIVSLQKLSYFFLLPVMPCPR